MGKGAEMPAGLFGQSMGLGEDRLVEDVWFESPEDAPGELHVRVGRVPGRAVGRPVRGGRRGVYDAGERTWRHLDVWQSRTVVHCKVPRADCPGHDPRTVSVPWEARPNSRFTALLEAQVPAAAMRGATVKSVAGCVGESGRRVWDMPNRAVSEAGAGAGCSGVAC